MARHCIDCGKSHMASGDRCLTCKTAKRRTNKEAAKHGSSSRSKPKRRMFARLRHAGSARKRGYGVMRHRPSVYLSVPQRKALEVAAKRGAVFGGLNDNGRGGVARISGAACAALERAGLLVGTISPDGGTMYQITEAGRAALTT